PLHCGVRVTALREHPGGDGYLVEAEAEQMTFAARNVVLATGAFPKAKLPAASAALSVDICQMHTSAYRNPQPLPAGAVLVGGAESGRGCRRAGWGGWVQASQAVRSPKNCTRAGDRCTCPLQAVEESLAATEAKTPPGGSPG